MNASAWVPGAQIGEYRLLEQLGAGAMGAVWRVQHLPTGALRALKTSLVGEGEAARRFEREARALAELEHPNVTRVHTAGVALGREFLVMDLAPGGDLAERLKAGPLDPEQARLLVRDLAQGLAHVHGRGLLHRDLKPSNVLFADDGRPMLVDFGLARRIDGSSLTQTGAVLGTPAYMSPEQAEGSKQVDERTDVYGLGAVLYHALSGQPPFTGPSLINVLRQVIAETPRPPSLTNPEVSPELEAVCLKALAKDPGQRYPSARAFAAALDAPVAERANRSPPLVLMALAALLGVGGLAFALTRGEELAVDPPPKSQPTPPVAKPDPAPPAELPAPTLDPFDAFVEGLPTPDPSDLVDVQGRQYDPHVLFERRSGGGWLAPEAKRDLLELHKPRLAAAWLYHLAQGPADGFFPHAWKMLGDLIKESAHREALWPDGRWEREGGAVVRECYRRGAEAGRSDAMVAVALRYIHAEEPGLEADPPEGLRWLRKALKTDKSTERQLECKLHLASFAWQHPDVTDRPSDEEAIEYTRYYEAAGSREEQIKHALHIRAELLKRRD